MVKHIILWNLKEEYSKEQKKEILATMKRELEGLLGKIPGLLDIKVQITRLESSNCDVMLDTSFESAEALSAYAVHPLHVEAANKFVRPHTAHRSCIDFEV